MSTSSAPSHVTAPDHPFYRYTGGRWLFNEALRLAERQIHFDLDALCATAAKSVGKSSDDILRFTKLAEGGSYRVFEVNFYDGTTLIARLPFPSTVPRTFGTASEAATMAFLRHRGFPVPAIYDWNSSTDNPVGSEYIIMEKCLGQELQDIWYTMDLTDRKGIVQKIVEFESRLSALELPASGSLYFRNSLASDVETIDVPNNDEHPDAHEFCIGPSTERLWWYNMRSELDVSRGPWASSDNVIAAVGRRELAWVKKYGRPRLQREAVYRSIHGHKVVNPQEQIQNLSNYCRIVHQTTPKERNLTRPVLRHPDMSPNNIFISGSGDISGIIDWQHSVALPLFLQAKMPKHFQNFGDEDSEALKPPQLPENFESLSEQEKEFEGELYRRRQLHYFYLGFTYRENKALFDAILGPDAVARTRLYEAAGRPWEGDSISLKTELIRTVAEWPKFVSSTDTAIKCPIKYTESESKECLAMDARQREADENMEKLRNHIGINIDGWVSNEMYDEAKDRAQQLKKQMLDSADTEDERREIMENWPFQDHEEID